MENIFPQEILDSVTGFNHEFRQQILSYLILNNTMTYSELKKSIDAKNGNLNHHLHLLQKGSLVSKYLQQNVDGKVFSYYKITDFGKSFIEGLMAPLRTHAHEKMILRQSTKTLSQIHMRNSFGLSLTSHEKALTQTRKIKRENDIWLKV